MTSNKREPRRLLERDDLEGPEAEVAALLAQVESPRPGPHSRTRVWASLQRPKPSMRPWVLAAFGGAAAAALIVLGLRSLETPSIEVLEGPAQLERFASSVDHVQTTERSRVRLAGMMIADLEPDTEIITRPADDRITIELLRGGITVAPLAGVAPKLRLSTKPYLLEGAATAKVTRVGASDVSIEVLAGEATVTGPSGTRTLRAGDRFDSAALASLQPTPPVPVPVPVPAPVPVPTPKEPPPTRPSRPSKRATPKPTDWSALYQRAIREPDPARAIELFDRLAASNTQWSEISALQAARLEMRRGRCPTAVDRFERLLGGAFDPEVRLDVIECQLSQEKLSDAERSVDAFLRAHPKSEREAELRFLRADLSRRRGRCAAAIPDYAAAESSSHADDAIYFGAWCKLEVGRTDEGLATLRRYLERFPDGRHAREAKKKL